MENFDIFALAFFLLAFIFYVMGVVYFELGKQIMITPFHWAVFLMIGCFCLLFYRVYSKKK